MREKDGIVVVVDDVDDVICVRYPRNLFWPSRGERDNTQRLSDIYSEFLNKA